MRRTWQAGGESGERDVKTLLVTGASGLLGFNLCRAALGRWKVYGMYCSHPVALEGVNMVRSDATRFAELKEMVLTIGPHAVIHAAALAKPNACQEDPVLSRAVNVDASINIAGICSDLAIPCVFVSTDLVFDGLNPPYQEDDPVSPVSVYGEHKVEAEIGMQERHPGTVVCRTSLMFGDDASPSASFIQPMIAAMKEGRSQMLFVDEWRTLLSVRCAAEGIFLALSHARGRLHLGGAERVSRYEFGQTLKEVLGLPEARLIAAHRRDVSMAAPRPEDVSLDSSRALALGFTPPPLKVQLNRLLTADYTA